jgi:hypothetical protein
MNLGNGYSLFVLKKKFLAKGATTAGETFLKQGFFQKFKLLCNKGLPVLCLVNSITNLVSAI